MSVQVTESVQGGTVRSVTVCSGDKSSMFSDKTANFKTLLTADAARLAKNYWPVYLSNVPENATVKNIHGAVRGKIGKFRSLSSAFLSDRPGTCQLVLKDEFSRDKLLAGPLVIFGVTVETSKDPPKVGAECNYYPVYVRGLPKDLDVKKFLGLAKKVVGEFAAMNKVAIDAKGLTKITFQSKNLQTSFVQNYNAIDELDGIEASVHPFIDSSSPPSSFGMTELPDIPGNVDLCSDSHTIGMPSLVSSGLSQTLSAEQHQPLMPVYAYSEKVSNVSGPSITHTTPSMSQGIMWMNVMQADGNYTALPFNIVQADANSNAGEIGSLVLHTVQPNGRVVEARFVVTPAFPQMAPQSPGLNSPTYSQPQPTQQMGFGGHTMSPGFQQISPRYINAPQQPMMMQQMRFPDGNLVQGLGMPTMM